MNIEETPLAGEINKVLSASNQPIMYRYSVAIETPKGIFPVLRLLDMDVLRDYELDFMENRMIRVAVAPGVYSTQIFPEKDNLKCHLTIYPLYAASYKDDLDIDINVRIFRATMTEDAKPMLMESNEIDIMSAGTLDLTDILSVTFQLMDPLVERLKVEPCGGVYRRTDPVTLLSTLLTKYGSEEILDDELKLKGVDIVDKANRATREHMIIPQGTKLIELADYAQQNLGGVYSTGMSQFIQDRHWFVGPAYDTTRFDDVDEKVILINVPSKRYVNIEKTYRIQGRVTVVLCTGDMDIQSFKESNQQNYGNGVGFSNADAIMENYVKREGNRALVNRGAINQEFVSEPRRNGINNTVVPNHRSSANPFVFYSDLARRQGHLFLFNWENATDDIIKPSMPIRLYFMRDGELVELDGIIIKTKTHVRMRGKGLVGQSYTTSITGVVFVKSIDQTALMGLQ